MRYLERSKINSFPSGSISDMDDSGFLRSASPNLPSIANLFIDHVKVCHQRIDLPEVWKIYLVGLYSEQCPL